MSDKKEPTYRALCLDCDEIVVETDDGNSPTQFLLAAHGIGENHRVTIWQKGSGYQMTLEPRHDMDATNDRFRRLKALEDADV